MKPRDQLHTVKSVVSAFLLSKAKYTYRPRTNLFFILSMGRLES